MNKNRQKTKRWKITLTVLIVVGAILSGVCVIYLNDYYCADAAASEALKSDDAVEVEWIDDNGIVFLPTEPEAGLIFYPGGKVEFTAYAPLLRSLAEEGILCVLIKMPCNLAVLDIDAAEGMQEKFPEIGDWYIGGHFLGGAMAAGYVADHVDEYKGLILLAA
ncbi:MAG: alpha/beta hydrolase, partial [Oscillospiraceae bacterium]|nr:alpha/beta hydrolase [Oscillospiraceae bacterium]